MLSIRTQDRMALVPYDARIEIEYNVYKVVNENEIEKIKEENKILRIKMIEDVKKEKDKFTRNLGLLTVTARWEKEKKEVPKEIYSEWKVKINGESSYGHLGTYTTKERALEVLDEIEKALEKTTRYLVPEYLPNPSFVQRLEFRITYQMPKEEIK